LPPKFKFLNKIKFKENQIKARTNKIMKSCLKKQSAYPIKDENNANNNNNNENNDENIEIKNSKSNKNKGVKLNDETFITKYTKGTEPALVGMMMDRKLKKPTKISKIASTKVDTSNVEFGMLGTSLFHLDLDYQVSKFFFFFSFSLFFLFLLFDFYVCF